ncbi:hypothetical protein [Chryseobacterium oryctis]|uniref:Uncharacterized protein n=1 Tax=Chryseobacterium oryctis TaxID=2952618 RepID=A0ABT3HKP5_9FLAO|nr:hypothetical protein [Chryseobacterium oryctis]MCW3160368.1 hypothetical protein [Chryseobacterium oryctis]
MKDLFSFLAILLFSILQAQELKDFRAPNGYKKIVEVKGDLDKDGKAETVIVFLTDRKVESDFNKGYLREIFILKNINDKLKTWKRNSNIIFASDTGFYPESSPLPDLQIKNNCLIISQQFNTNSRHTQSYKHTFRFQNGDFYLIGSVGNFNDTCEFNILNDINFSTGKVIVDEQYYPCNEEEETPGKNFYKEFIYKSKLSVKMDNFIPGENSIRIPKTNKYFNF